MKPLLSPENIKALEALSFTRTLYAFDFDGTLAPIVANPANARMSKQTEKLLASFSALAPVALISSRTLSDLRLRANLPSIHLLANHGPAKEAEQACTEWANRFTDSNGINVENKGFSLAIHYRNSRTKALAKREILRTAQALSPQPRIIFGKCVLNLVPEGAPHKGVALTELMKIHKVQRALYIGDDETDEDVFSLPEANESRIFTIRIGRKSASRANYFLTRRTEINRLLGELITFHRRNE